MVDPEPYLSKFLPSNLVEANRRTEKLIYSVFFAGAIVAVLGGVVANHLPSGLDFVAPVGLSTTFIGGIIAGIAFSMAQIYEPTEGN